MRSLQPSASHDWQRDPRLQLLSILEPPPWDVQNAAGVGRGVVSHPAFTCCRISKASSEADSARHAARLAVGTQSGHCHLHVGSSLCAGKEGSSEHPSCARSSSSQAGPMIPSLRGLPSVAPCRSGVLGGRKTPGSPTAWQGAPEVREQTKRSLVVLSCGSRSGVGNGKASTGRSFLFLPSPSHSGTFCAQFFPALQAGGLSSLGDVKSHLSRVCNALGLGPAAAQMCLAEPSQPGQFTGGKWGQRARSDPRQQGLSLPSAPLGCAPGEAVLLWHREREGVANRIRSCGPS